MVVSSDPRRDREPVGPARRIRGDVVVAADGLVAEVRDLGVQSGVTADREQVAPAEAELQALQRSELRGEPLGQVVRDRDLAQLHERAILDVAARIARGEQRLALDRKSTRLNSSHVEISYAVFCLKKKKNITNR